MILFRSVAQRSGKWNVPACVVKRVENEKQVFLYFAQKPKLGKENLGR